MLIVKFLNLANIIILAHSKGRGSLSLKQNLLCCCANVLTVTGLAYFMYGDMETSLDTENVDFSLLTLAASSSSSPYSPPPCVCVCVCVCVWGGGGGSKRY